MPKATWEQFDQYQQDAGGTEEFFEHRPCTCHPDDWPEHIPCQRKYAFKDCAIEAIRQNLAMIK